MPAILCSEIAKFIVIEHLTNCKSFSFLFRFYSQFTYLQTVMDGTIEVNQNALHSRSHYYNSLIINYRYCFIFLKN